ncbi:extracellular solute-binding protein [Paenibacillus mesophilus]|uniref:ABC transporter substrate-binding protein n=1 Tax=Paenibacillus mesophilus TaxID=2582849 RepID=UPI00110D4D18|nr:extracellular solute-binding protein [Paenibacillus mesophilus]TMV48734.1 extracellular solute-binding protein [Paenibacillus mesophilus]
MKRKLQLVVASLTVASLLAACSSSNKPESNATAKPAEPESNEPVEINLVTPDATITADYLAALQKKFPKYKINHIDQSQKGKTIEDLITTGVPIDIVGRAGTGFYNDVVNMKLELDMSSYIKEYKINLNDFEPQLINYIRSISNGGMYGIPGGSAINHLLFYNKSLFDKFGVSYLKDGMTWNEVMDVSAKLTRSDSGINYYGFTGHLGVMTSWNQLGVSLVDPKTNKPTINTDERWKSYFQTVYGNTTLNEAYRRDNRAFSGSTARLVEGRTAILLFNAGIALVTKELQEETINWDMVSLPSFKEAPNTGSPMNSTIWGLTKQTRNKKAAMEVIAYLVSDENLLPLAKKGFLVPKITEPYIKNFGVEAKPAGKNWKAVIHNKYAPFPATNKSNSQIEAIHVKYIEGMIKGQYDMNTALRMAEEEAQKVIDTNNR